MLDEGLIIDNFAGGGGASTGIEMALGRSPDVAINHDAEAVALHQANHPDTMHLCQNVWKADPREVVRQASARRCAALGIPFRELPVRFAWFSPDCKHFSKAKGSKPVEKGIRDLAWVVVHWARLVKPDVIGLENVEEFKDWGPLVAAEGGKLVPCPLNKGLTFKRWCRELKRLGYKVEARELRACDYGAPTIRKRLFVIARRDGKPIVWPEPTHAKPAEDGSVPDGMLPWRTAAECIDWSLPCPSIFTRTKANGEENPLAENTLKRIARGIMRYVVNADKPFIVSAAHGGTTGRAPYAWSSDEPLRTQKASTEYGVVEPFIAGVGGRMGQSPERPVDVPVQTITAKADAAVVQPFVARIGQTGGGGKYVNGIEEPVTTITSKAEHLLVEPFTISVAHGESGGRREYEIGQPLGAVTAQGTSHAIVEPLVASLTHHGGDRVHAVDDPFKTITAAHRGEMALIAPHVTKFRANSDGHPADEPLHTITAGGTHHAIVQLDLSPEDLAGAQRVAAFIAKYYGAGAGQEADEPLHTVTTKDRFALVMVKGMPIVDIGMRMLQPPELYKAQGFPSTYRITVPGPTGKPLTKTAQVRMCGNSVSPVLAKALAYAQFANENADLGERAAD